MAKVTGKEALDEWQRLFMRLLSVARENQTLEQAKAITALGIEGDVLPDKYHTILDALDHEDELGTVEKRTMFLSRYYLRDLQKYTRTTIHMYPPGVEAIPIKVPLIPSTYWTREEQELPYDVIADLAATKKAREALEGLRQYMSIVGSPSPRETFDITIAPILRAFDRKDELEGQGFVELVNKMVGERDEIICTLKKRIRKLENLNIGATDELLEALSKQGILRDELKAARGEIVELEEEIAQIYRDMAGESI